jgi:hypothetical protein
MKKLFLTGVAALFLATGTAHAEANASMLDLSMHRGDNPVFLFLEKDNGQKYFGFFSIQENCADILTLLERRRDAGMETWLTLRAGKIRARSQCHVVGVHQQCPPNVAGETETRKNMLNKIMTATNRAYITITAALMLATALMLTILAGRAGAADEEDNFPD